MWRRVIPTIFIALLATACMSPSRHESARESKVADSAVTLRVESRLKADPVTQGSTIAVETMEGVVNLSGFVDTLKERNRALEVVRSVEGVRRVKDSLTVKEPADG